MVAGGRLVGSAAYAGGELLKSGVKRTTILANTVVPDFKDLLTPPVASYNFTTANVGMNFFESFENKTVGKLYMPESKPHNKNSIWLNDAHEGPSSSAGVKKDYTKDVNNNNSVWNSNSTGTKIANIHKPIDAASALRADHLAKMEKFKSDINKGVLDKAEKGIFGEDKAAYTMNYLKDYQVMPSKLPGNKGMDHIFIKYDVNGAVNDIMIIESKFQINGGVPKLAKAGNEFNVQQLSDAWVQKQIGKLKDTHPETYKTLFDNQDKIRLKANVLDKTGIQKWYDYGNYNPVKAEERSKAVRKN